MAVSEQDVDQDLADALSQQYGSSVEPNQLCEACQRMVTTSQFFRDHRQREVKSTESFEHHGSSQALRAAARGGCHLCSLLCHSIKENYPWTDSAAYSAESELSPISISGYENFPEELIGAYNYVNFWIIGGSAGQRKYPDVFACDITTAEGEDISPAEDGDIPLAENEDAAPAEDENAESDEDEEPLLDSTGSLNTQKFVLTRYLDCLSRHPSCRESMGPRVLPTRLLEIQSAPARLRVINTSDLPVDTRYATLSYVWGGVLGESTGPHVNLQPNGYTDIPYASLAPTLQDAVVLVARFGLRYLWIDRLCIEQSSNADFEHEVTKMGTYYAMGALHLGSLDASNSEDRLITHHNPLSFTPFEYTSACGRRIRLESRYATWTHDLADQRYQNARLLTRGWVLQERVLAPRTVYFTGDPHGSLLWECREETWGEHGIYPSIFEEARMSNFHVTKAQISRALGTSATLPRQMFWQSLISDYTSCSTTFPTDRWNAIAGLSFIISQQLGLDILDGLWLYCLPVELLWRPKHGTRSSRINNSTRITSIAPSWSWLSVTFGVNLVHWQAELCNLTYHVTKKTEQYPDANLEQLWDHFCKIPYHRLATVEIVSVDRESAVSQHRHGCGVTPLLIPAEVVARREYWDTLIHQLRTEGILVNGAKVWLEFDFPKDIAVPGRRVYLLPIRSRHSDTEIQGLIITSVDSTKNYWTRLGVFDFFVIRPMNQGVNMLPEKLWPTEEESRDLNPVNKECGNYVILV
jgi:hypothetical protein